jgi:hypothetical protein
MTTGSKNTPYKERPNDTRASAPRPVPVAREPQDVRPAAGAHAARHLVNEEATPGAGALPSYASVSGNEVDGGAG